MEVALFPSNGCYSHDMMMQETGQEFSDHHNVSWFQSRVYSFGANQIQLPDKWQKIILNRTEKRGREIRQIGGTLLWEINVPMDHGKPWDLRGAHLFFNILKLHSHHCGEFVRSQAFKHYIQNTHADLVIVDHFIQECFVAASSLLRNSTSVMFSNWPIADGYITALGVPANPAVVPKTGTIFSSTGMSFLERVQNTIFHWIITVVRQIHAQFINYFYANWGYPDIDLDQIQAKHLLYAGRSEFLAEAIRPLTNQIKHFGCVKCRQKSDFQIRRPATFTSNKSYNSPLRLSTSNRHSSEEALVSRKLSIIIDTNKTANYMPIQCGNECTKKTKNKITPKINNLILGNLTEMESRYVKTQMEFQDLDLQLLNEGPFVLVSFGSVAEANLMPKHLWEEFIRTFESVDHLRFVWQTNSGVDELIGHRQMPKNVILLKWAPVKILLAHPNLHYAILHGGINTINELLFFGIPALGIPLQGDQLSNVQRLTELGMAESSTIGELHYPGVFLQKLREFEDNLPLLTLRARKVSQMIATYRELNANQQHFWLHWAQRHGQKLQSIDSNGDKRKYFSQDVQDSFDYFMVKELAVWTSIIGFLVYIVSH